MQAFIRRTPKCSAIVLAAAGTLAFLLPLGCRTPILPRTLKSPGTPLPANLLPRTLPRQFMLGRSLERYNPSDLWKKIDGAADLFLAYGFRGLLAANYTRPHADLPEVEVSIYEMGSALNAMGVFLAERSEGAEKLPIGWDGYQTDTGLFFYKGPYYVKIVDLSNDGSLGSVVKRAGEYIDGRIHVKHQTVPEMDVFPKKDMVPDSTLYVLSDALGHSFLKHVFKAEYMVAGKTATLFYCRQKDTEPLLAKYREYGKEFGKIEREWQDGGLKFLSIQAFNSPELVFSRGDVFGGVLGCADQAKALELIRALLENIDLRLGGP